MPILGLRKHILDKLWILWALCLIQHYREQSKRTSEYEITAEFGERNWRYFKIACETADNCGLLDRYHMRLTPKGLAAVDNWERINQKLYSL